MVSLNDARIPPTPKSGATPLYNSQKAGTGEGSRDPLSYLFPIQKGDPL